ncbi:hypothetical protein HNR67_002037 [Crossiella cryophila]|uniref:Uncharacterized protein n=1 Tax=Crossiella cryophila TaxID=43355 RepID=A0A7W7CA29_9PSEU|nr:hypothetical protein [Crossiella cryophila]
MARPREHSADLSRSGASSGLTAFGALGMGMEE